MTDAPISRRALLAGAAGALGARALRLAQAQAPALPPDPTKVPGAPVSPLGQRSPFERPRRIPVGNRQGSSLTPLQELYGIVTPADLHFERHHAGVPAIDPHRYKLLIHGDRKSTRLNSSHGYISYAVFCLKKKKNKKLTHSSAT